MSDGRRRRKLRTITLVAIALAWVPILNVMLATPAHLDADTENTVDSRAAFWAMVVSWTITVGVLLFFFYILASVNQEDPAVRVP